MTTDFFYRDVGDFDEDGDEHDGSKSKFWLTDHDKVRWLFKVGRNDTENWAEIVAAEICKLLDIPHVGYELAQYKGKKGTISRNFLGDDSHQKWKFIPMRWFIQQACEWQGIKFDKNARLQEMYYVGNVLDGLITPGITTPQNVATGLHDRGAMFFFYGYLVLDALIANTDRHDENWGICTKGNLSDVSTFIPMRLTPTFDHGAAFCKEPVEKQQQRLLTRDKGFGVAAWCRKAKTPFHDHGGRVLGTLEVLEEFANLIDEINRRLPELQKGIESIEARYKQIGGIFPDKDLREVVPFWREKVDKLDVGRDVEPILNRFPHDIMSPVGKQFALEMLTINRESILETLNEDIK